MLNSSEGLVLVNGKNINDKLDEIINDMGLCPQEIMLFPSLTVQQQLKFFAMVKYTKQTYKKNFLKTNINFYFTVEE